MKGVLPQKAFYFLAKKVFGVQGIMDEFNGRPEHEAVPDKDNLSIH